MQLATTNRKAFKKRHFVFLKICFVQKIFTLWANSALTLVWPCNREKNHCFVRIRTSLTADSEALRVVFCTYMLAVFFDVWFLGGVDVLPSWSRSRDSSSTWRPWRWRPRTHIRMLLAGKIGSSFLCSQVCEKAHSSLLAVFRDVTRRVFLFFFFFSIRFCLPMQDGILYFSCSAL